MKLKTPLRYPGGKSRAVPKLLQWLPSRKITEYREPFLGGGSMAIEMTRRLPEEIPIWVNDLYEPLYNFWVQLRDNGDYLHRELMRAKNFHPDEESARKLFLDAKEQLNEDNTDPKDRAILFILLISVLSVVLQRAVHSQKQPAIPTSPFGELNDCQNIATSSNDGKSLTFPTRNSFPMRR